MGNLRGNVYSRNHISLNPDVIVGPFWDFSWWESGVEDIPAMLDYVMKITGQDKLQVSELLYDVLHSAWVLPSAHKFLGASRGVWF